MSNFDVPQNLKTIAFSIPYEDALELQSLIKESNKYHTIQQFSFSISPLFPNNPQGTQKVEMTFKNPNDSWTSVYGVFSFMGYCRGLKYR